MSDLEYVFMENNAQNYLLYYLPNARKNDKTFIKITSDQIKNFSRPKQYIFDVLLQ